MEKAEVVKCVMKSHGIEITGFSEYADGFSVRTSKEVEAYKIAYIYRGCKVKVSKLPSLDEWLVQIYAKLG